jgi:cytochrome d ubiquinol oxidase subunit I
MYLFGWVNNDKKEVSFSVAMPGMLSWLIHFDTNKPVRGLDSFDKKNIPPVNFVFQTYHIMIAIGMALILISFVSLFLLRGGRLYKNKLWLKLLIASVVLPHLGNQLGWISAEVGRQPWIVYNLLRTSEALSKSVQAEQVWFSLILFSLIYILLFVLYIYLLNKKIQHGPQETGEAFL